MTRKGFSDAGRLLHDLLDRFEAQPKRLRFLNYSDENGFRSVEARDRFIETIKAAEKGGGVKLEYSRRVGEAALRIRLLDANALYGHLGRAPSRQRVQGMLAGLQHHIDLPATSRAVLDDLAEGWMRGVKRFGLAPDDLAGLRNALALARALGERGTDAGVAATDFRTFSRAAGADSKALDRLAATVVTLHARLYPEQALSEDLDFDDALATFGVSRTPQPLLISGPVAVCGTRLPDLQYHGVPPDQGDAISLSSRVDYVMMIENYTSFIRHAREINIQRSGLILYTGGFPARSHLRQIVHLSCEAKAPVFHWGDLDAGGVRIFRHIEQALRPQNLPLQPHLMTPAILRTHGVAPMMKQHFPADGGLGSAITDLCVALRETGLTLEQETLAPQSPF